MDPPAENHRPQPHDARTDLAFLGQLTVRPTLVVPRPPPICLVKAHAPTQAYALQPGKEPSPVGAKYRHPEWGSVYFGVVYRCIGDNTFQAPMPMLSAGQESLSPYVAIKRLNKRVVNWYLDAGGAENPYKEVARMNELGDNLHVLQCMEFLQDEKYLYIVTPQACQEGTLKDIIAWNNPDEIMDPYRAYQIFCKMLQILGYLERNGINHRDLSPDNFLFLTPDNLVVFDLAMSLRIPVNSQTGHRALIKPQGACGTYPCMAPEIFENLLPYDGVATDLWGVSVILYCLFTNQLLYLKPETKDISYCYFLHARGLSSAPMNEDAIEQLQLLSVPSATSSGVTALRYRLLQQARMHLNLSEELVHLLERLLAVDPSQRCTLAEAMESHFVQSLE
jgi:serine/threonine protein kinase